MGYALNGIADDPETTTCSARFIARVLGRQDYGRTRLTTYLQRLVDRQDFPIPLPTLCGTELVLEVTPDSRWIRAAVEKWLIDRLPPAAIVALAGAERQAAIDDIDFEAGNLRIIDGGRA